MDLAVPSLPDLSADLATAPDTLIADLATATADLRVEAPDLRPPPPDLGPCVGVACGPFRFDPAVSYPVKSYPLYKHSVDAVDVNGDGRPDLVAACASGYVSVLINQGAGKFAPAQSIPVKRAAMGLAAADFDGDGRVDFAVSTELGYVVSVFLNCGNLQFTGPIETAVKGAPVEMGTADFNEDGKPDVVADSGGGANYVQVLLNTGGGRFNVQELKPVPDPPPPPGWFGIIDSMPDVLARDLDGDGHTDIIASYAYLPHDRPQYRDLVLVLFGDGKGAFQGPFFRATNGGDFYWLGAGDLDGDGRLDLAVAAGWQERVDVVLNTGKRADPGVAVPYPAGDGIGIVNAITVGDLDRDGRPDVVVLRDRARLLRNLGGGKLSYLQALPVNPSQGLASPILRDLDGDGRLDLAIGYLVDLQTYNGAIAVFLNRTP